MLAIPKYHGLELPVYGRDTKVLKTPSQFQEAVKSGETEFVREVGLIKPSGLNNLEECLEVGDRELNHIAELCGGVVVKHEWGLAPNRLRLFGNVISGRWSKAVEIPRGLSLVASVAAIRPVPTPAPILLQTYAGFHQYELERRTGPEDDGIKLFDINGSQQFVYGPEAQSPNEMPNNTLVDIDLYFRTVSPVESPVC